MDWIESQQLAPLRESQDIIRQGNLSTSPSSVEEIPLGQGDSLEVKFGPQWPEPSEQDAQDFVQEMKQRITLLDMLDAISGHSSKP